MTGRSPLAYFLTFSTYGSHLPGGRSESISKDQNGYGQPTLAYRPALESSARSRLKHDTVVLDFAMRAAVESAIREHCQFKNWILQAVNVRTNHVHVVVTAEEEPPDAVLRQFKSWSTRKLRDLGLAAADLRPWARGGSRRFVWTEADMSEVVDYVVFQQGRPLT